MQPKMETAADRYRRLKKETEILHPVTCKCGMEWQCRKAEKTFWVTSGMLPMSAVETMVTMAQNAGKSQEELLEKLDWSQMKEAIAFSSDAVKYTAVDPKIVETAKEPNELAYDEVMPCCYATLRDWQFKGGVEAEGLGNFPKQ